MRRTWQIGAAALILAAGLAAVIGGWYDRQQVPDGLPEGGDIELDSTIGAFSLARLEEDQLAVVFFGYTWCPDACPMSLGVVRQVRQQLSDAQRRRVVPLMVSVDPERDSLERLEEYLGFFGEDFIGATGSPAELEELAERYAVIWRKVDTPDSAADYTIDHSVSLYLVNREGEILQRVLHSPTAGPLRAALMKELAET